MKRIEVNVITGKQRTIRLTDAEIEVLQASAAPSPEPPAPVKLTPAEKLEAAGLTVDELKELLGLSNAN